MPMRIAPPRAVVAAAAALLLLSTAPSRAQEGADKVYKDGLETRVTPPHEVVLTVRAAEKLLEAGLVPVLSLKGSESVRVARLQSIAKPPRALAGRWRSAP